MSIDEKRRKIHEHLKTIKEEKGSILQNVERNFNYWLAEITASKASKDSERMDISYRNAVFLALQKKYYDEASILLEEYKKQAVSEQSDWHNRYSIQLYSNSPRFFLDNPNTLYEYLEPIAMQGTLDEKTKISNIIISYVLIYENIYKSKSTDKEKKLIIRKFIDAILPISNQISEQLSIRLQLFKDLIDNKITQYEYENYEKQQRESLVKSTVQDFDLENNNVKDELKRKSKVLIIGQPHISVDEIFIVAKQFGFNKKNLEMYTDYDKMKNLDIRRFRNTEKYEGIVLGPIPHSVKGKDYDSVLASILSSTDGYPYWIKCMTESGEFKMTRTAFEKAMEGIRFYKEGSRV